MIAKRSTEEAGAVAAAQQAQAAERRQKSNNCWRPAFPPRALVELIDVCPRAGGGGAQIEARGNPRRSPDVARLRKREPGDF